MRRPRQAIEYGEGEQAQEGLTSPRPLDAGDAVLFHCLVVKLA